jgi:GNAT superfamily N-acetyltransferase
VPPTIRPATTDDAPALAALYAGAKRDTLPAGRPTIPGDFELLMQTGSAFLVAEAEDASIAGAVRFRDEDGIAWFDLLCAARAGVGRTLVRKVETGAQDRGIRLVRLKAPAASRLPLLFETWGYRPVGHSTGEDGANELVMERRLALLTVREQRREDAEAIGRIAAIDPWVFEQGARPGWFVAADGERVVGVISVSDTGGGLAALSVPALLADYLGRGLEAWMVERAATYAETNGYHTAEVPAEPRTDAVRKALEDHFWYRDATRYLRRFRDIDPTPED